MIKQREKNNNEDNNNDSNDNDNHQDDLVNDSNDNDNQDDLINVDGLKSCAVEKGRIDRMKKIIKTHRAAVDFDKGFCNVRVTYDVEGIDEDEKRKKEKESRHKVYTDFKNGRKSVKF